MKTTYRILGLSLVWLFWLWIALKPPALPEIDLLAASVAALAVLPIVFLARRALNRQTSVQGAQRLSEGVYFLLEGLLGAAVICAVRYAVNDTHGLLLVPRWLGLPLILAGGVIWLLAVFQLTLRGFGLPFALGLTRIIVTDWIYAWTRNPILLSAFAFLIGLGVWLGSGVFLVWLLMILSPVMGAFLKMYEERELEIRFGQEYLEYRKRTPMFLPRRPQH